MQYCCSRMIGNRVLIFLEYFDVFSNMIEKYQGMEVNVYVSTVFCGKFTYRVAKLRTFKRATLYSISLSILLPLSLYCLSIHSVKCTFRETFEFVALQCSTAAVLKLC